MKILKRIIPLTLLIFALSPIAVQAAPDAPILTSPMGMLTVQPPEFEWSPVPDATWYRIWVKDESGVVISDWKKAEEVCGSGACGYFPNVRTEGAAVWQVRGYDGTLGAWSERAKFFDNLTAPRPTTLVAPLSSTSDSTPVFTWTPVPEASWYKIQIINQFEELIANQWLRADSTNVDCDPDVTNLCSKTPMVSLSGDFEWRVRTYNAAGLGPWTPRELVSFVSGSPLSANPNPVSLGACFGLVTIEIMVTNDSDDLVTGIAVLDAVGDSIFLVDDDDNSAIECEDVLTSLEPGESCVITRKHFGDGVIAPAANFIPVTGDNIAQLNIDVEANICF